MHEDFPSGIIGVMDSENTETVVVVTAVGRDQPGIIAALAKAVFDLGGNLDDATMTRLHGAFSTMVAARLPHWTHRGRRAGRPRARGGRHRG